MIKIAKKGFIKRETDVARRGHVAEPLRLTRTHVGAYVVRKLRTRAKLIGPTGTVGPGKIKGGGGGGGGTRPSGRRKAIKASALI